MTIITPSRRIRRTPYSDGVEKAGVKSYTVYNRMLLATSFQDLEADYHHLKRHVQVWDVSCERQVEITGPDAAKLMQKLTPRDLASMQIGQCYYIPVVDESGGMLNDPVALKLAEDRFWVSIADSDLSLWIKGLAAGFGLDVRVFEPDVSPLALQGPKSDDLAARVFGSAVRDLRFFRFAPFEFEGHRLLISRSGFSKQGGFEVFVDDSALGMALWNRLFEAGDDLEVRPGSPNLIERVEGGLLSYGNDMTQENTPMECGLARFCTPGVDCIGAAALASERQRGPSQQVRAIAIEGVPSSRDRAWAAYAGGRQVGQVTSTAFSPDFGTTVAIGMIAHDHWDPGTALEIETLNGMLPATVQPSFWI